MKKTILLLLCVLMVFTVSCKKAEEPVEEFVADEEYAEETGATYLKDLFSGKYEDAYNGYPHDEAMTKAVNPQNYGSIFNSIYEQQGNFKSLNGSATKIEGEYFIFTSGVLFEKGELNANVVFNKKGELAGLNFSAYTFGEASLPEGIKEIDVKFGLEDWELTGKITLPEVDGFYPALVLVHGSGPNNMNETVGLNEPFKDIAYYLAQNGIAVLRYDKRTYTYSNKMASLTGLTVYEETIDDAAEAVEFLGNLDYINKNKIFVLGHSLGGYLMPRIAEKTPEAAGYIMASGIYTSLGEIIPYQIDYLNNIDGLVTEEEEKMSEETKALAYKTLNPDTIAEDEIVLGAYKAYWEDLAGYNSIESAKKIEKPVFVFQGDRDYQVPVDEYNLIHEALSSRDNFTFKLYPGLNHLLMFGEEKSTPQEYYTKGTVYEPLLDNVIEFIK